jgi:hypothetical protein
LAVGGSLMVKKLYVFFLFILIINTHAFPLKIETTGKIKLLDNKDTFLQIPVGIAVTEDNIFLVVDFKAGDIKIYKNNGQLMGTISQKGYGPDELSQPLHCYYSNSMLFIDDVGQKKIFVYKRKGEFRFVRSKSFSFMSMGDDFYLDGKTLYTVGGINGPDGKRYSMLSFDLDTGKNFRYYLPVYQKLNLSSQEEYRKKIYSRSIYSILDTIGFFDFHGDYAYFSCMIDLKVFKINKQDGTFTTFGKKTGNYIQPYINGKIIDAANSGNREYIQEQKARMSFIRQIFTTDNHVLLLYGRRVKGTDYGLMMQLYTFSGDYITEVEMPGGMGFKLWLDKTTNTMYTPVAETMGDGEDQLYYMMKYKITGI